MILQCGPHSLSYSTGNEKVALAQLGGDENVALALGRFRFHYRLDATSHEKGHIFL